jgi:sigma-B regulation protein RsbU (phosphoserine phosphatase)
MSVRARLFLLLVALSVLPILLLRLNAQHQLRELSGDLVPRSQHLLVEKAKAYMRLMVEDHAELWRRESVLLEQTLRLQVMEIDKVLAAGAASAHRDAGATAHTDADSSGLLAEAYTNAARLIGNNVLGQVTIFEDGRVFASSGETGLPDRFVDRGADWYRLAKREKGMVWTAPVIDPTTRRIAFTLSTPVRDASGRVVGVTAIMAPLSIGGLSRMHTASVSSRLKTYLVDFAQADSPDKGLRIIGQADPQEPGAAKDTDSGTGPDTDAGLERGMGRGMGMMGSDMGMMNSGMVHGMGRGMGMMGVLAPAWLTPDDHAELQSMLSDLKNGLGEVRQAELDGKDYIWAYAPSGVKGLALVLVAPKSDVAADATQAAEYIERRFKDELRETLYLLLVALAVIAVAAWLVSRSVTRPILELSGAAASLGQGDFSVRLVPSGGRELREMGRVFNDMIPQLKDHTRLMHAVALAREVRLRLLPAALPALPGLDLAAASLSCEEVGGDSYDVFPVGHCRLGCTAALVGDVSGHGLDAALLMATARALLRMRASQPGTPADVVTDVNRFLTADTMGSGRFMTLFYMELSPRTRQLRWVRAGHDPAILYRAALGEFEELGGPGISLGVLEDRVFTESSRPWLAPGEVLLIGSDGLWETRGPDGGMFGKDRVREIMRENAGQSAQGVLEAILAALDAYRGDSPAEDDVTLLVIKAVTGPGDGIPQQAD